MSLRSDLVRVQRLNLRKGASASYDDDLAVSVMTNRARALQREKIHRLWRHR